MRIDGYYNREPSGLSDNTEEATFSFAHGNHTFGLAADEIFSALHGS